MSDELNLGFVLFSLNASTMKTIPSRPRIIFKALLAVSVLVVLLGAQIDGLDGRYLMRTVAFSSAFRFA